MNFDLPQIVVVGTVWTYWSCVLVLIVRSHLQFRTEAGAVPQTLSERFMWLVWLPAIILWQIFPYVAATAQHPFLTATGWMAADSGPIFAVRLVAAGAAVLAFLLTIPCWLSMGKDWSMAVVPSKESRLITQGMFSRVRHPIYGLSIILMVGTMVAVPSLAMILTGIVHITMIYLKAINEEKYMREVHGEQYAEYCRQTNRFLPGTRTQAVSDRSHDRRDAA